MRKQHHDSVALQNQREGGNGQWTAFTVTRSDLVTAVPDGCLVYHLGSQDCAHPLILQPSKKSAR